MIEKVLIISLFTIGYCCTFWPGMIFARVGEWMDQHAPEWLWKPLGGCYICACMWIGTIVYWVLYHKPFPGGGYTVDVKEWLICCICAMGFNAVISEFTNKPEEVEIKGTPEIKITTDDPPAF